VVVAYYSKALSAPEKNYCTTRRELLAVVKAVKHFKPYLYGRTFRLRTDHASLIWLCRRAEPSSQVARWLEILAEFAYRIEHGNADGLSRRQADGCKQCQNIERRDGGPPRSDVEEQVEKAGIYSWDEGQLRSEALSKAVNNLHANPTLLRNVKELCRLQATLPGVVADLVRAKKEGRWPSEAEQWVKCVEFKYFCNRWDSLRFNGDGLLTITLAAGTNRHERERVVCPFALRRELIWDTHKQAHAGAGRVTRCLQLQCFWPGMTRDVRLRVWKCEVCQASKHGYSTETVGRCTFR